MLAARHDDDDDDVFGLLCSYVLSYFLDDISSKTHGVTDIGVSFKSFYVKSSGGCRV